MVVKEGENSINTSVWLMGRTDFENCFWEDKRPLCEENYTFKKNNGNSPQEVIHWSEGGGLGLFCGKQLAAIVFNIVGECGESLVRLVFYPPFSTDLKIIEHLKKCRAIRE